MNLHRCVTFATGNRFSALSTVDNRIHVILKAAHVPFIWDFIGLIDTPSLIKFS
ncbi:hypothetical protein ACUYFE_08165 [Olegusella massiliensis]|uniref:hypothetical protein n=1 Tax=Olegusella massiliensis TaxID=1776381 RepID=UPI0040554393